MGTITGTAISAKVAHLLQDAGNVRWTAAELLLWINEGQRAAALLRPSLSTSRTVQTLVSGTRQTITDGHAMVDVPRNMAMDGVTPGRAIRPVKRDAMDAINPSWHSDTGDYVKHVMAAEGEPKAFYVWPAAVGKKIEVITAIPPAELSSISNAITLDDIYAGALTDYVLYRAYSKDADGESAPAAAQAYYTLFTKSLGA